MVQTEALRLMRGAGDCLLSGEMMSKSIAVILMLIVPLLLGGCALSYHGNLVSKLQAQGPNPYINEPELKDLYRNILGYVLPQTFGWSPNVITNVVL